MGNVADNLATKTFAPACQSEFDADGTAIAYDPNAFRSPQFRPKNYGNRGSNLSAPGSRRPGGGRIRASTSEQPRNKRRQNSSPMASKSPRAKSKANTQGRNSKKNKNTSNKNATKKKSNKRSIPPNAKHRKVPSNQSTVSENDIKNRNMVDLSKTFSSMEQKRAQSFHKTNTNTINKKKPRKYRDKTNNDKGNKYSNNNNKNQLKSSKNSTKSRPDKLLKKVNKTNSMDQPYRISTKGGENITNIKTRTNKHATATLIDEPTSPSTPSTPSVSNDTPTTSKPQSYKNRLEIFDPTQVPPKPHPDDNYNPFASIQPRQSFTASAEEDIGLNLESPPLLPTQTPPLSTSPPYGHEITNSTALHFIDIFNSTFDLPPTAELQMKSRSSKSRSRSLKVLDEFKGLHENSGSMSISSMLYIEDRVIAELKENYNPLDNFDSSMNTLDHVDFKMGSMERGITDPDPPTPEIKPLADTMEVSKYMAFSRKPKMKMIRIRPKDSVSWTQPGKKVQKEKKMQDTVRESIESTLSEATEKNYGIDLKKEDEEKVLGGQSLYTMEKPPLLPALPQHIQYWHDTANNNDYAICCTGHIVVTGNKSGVYLYNLKELKLKYLCAFPDKVWPKSMGMAIDYQYPKLHLFGGKGLFGQWLILNIKTGFWDVRKDLTDKHGMPFTFHAENPKCIVVEKSLHVYSKGRFMRYSKRKHSFIELQGIKGYDVKNVQFMFYVKSQRRIYVFGGYNDNPVSRTYFDDIWYCEHSESFHEYKWYRYKLQLPYHMELGAEDGSNPLTSKYNACLGFNNILFLFYHEKNEVWCIDLEKEKRYKCNKSVNIDGSQNSQFITTKANIAHSICMDHNGPIHSVLQMNDIVKSTPIS